MSSEYFNRNAEVTQAFGAIDESRQLPGPEGLHAKLFPNEPFEAQRAYDITSFLFRHLEAFLALRQQSDFEERLGLLEALRSRRQHQHFARTAKSARKHLEQATYRNDEHHLDAYLLESEADAFHIQEETRSADDRLQQVTDALDAFYLTAKLKHTCEMLSRINVVRTSYEIFLADELVAHIHEHWPRYGNIPSVAVYYRIYLALTKPEDELQFPELIALLEAHANKFPVLEARELYNFARNYCIKRINRGHTRYLNELFGLYKRLTETGLIYDGEFLTQWDYKNAITAGLRIEQYDWVKRFIYDQKERLDPRFRENAFSYNLSNFHYESGQPRQALRLLQSVEFTDVYYGLSARALLLKIYYEENDTESLLALCSSFSTYLKRNRLVSDYQYRVQSNLIRFVKKAYQLKLNEPKRKTEAFTQKVTALENEINETGEITNVNWLRLKVAELK